MHTAAAPASEAELWSWFEARRRGERYQPPADGDAGHDDHNGCGAKLRLLAGCGFRTAGMSLLSLGASSAAYEAELARRASRGEGRGVRPLRAGPPVGMPAVHLVDTNPESLRLAREAFAGLAVGELRTAESAADAFPLERDYDVGVFLSLYHHYDRLGGRVRQKGIDTLAGVGRRCSTLFFETGQTDDTVRGSEHWPRLLEMAGWASPEEWLEERVPEIAGYDACRKLGTNPMTSRHLYVYWRIRPLRLAAGFGAEPFVTVGGAALREAARFDLPGQVEVPISVAPGGALVCADAGERAHPLAAYGPPLEEVLSGLRDRCVLFDAQFTRPDVPDAQAAAATERFLALADDLDAGRFAVQTYRAGGLRAWPSDVNMALRAHTDSEEEALAAVRTAAWSGLRMVSLDAPLCTPAVLHEAEVQEVWVVALGAAPGGVRAPRLAVAAAA